MGPSPTGSFLWQASVLEAFFVLNSIELEKIPVSFFGIFFVCLRAFLPGESATPDAQGEVAGHFDFKRVTFFCFFLKSFLKAACVESGFWPAMSVSEPEAAGHCFCALGR